MKKNFLDTVSLGKLRETYNLFGCGISSEFEDLLQFRPGVFYLSSVQVIEQLCKGSVYIRAGLEAPYTRKFNLRKSINNVQNLNRNGS